MINNEVKLIDTYGSDEIHGLAAWVSTKREITPERAARLDKFLDSLISAGHHTPLEKSMLHFVLRTDIASHVHLLKHRVGVSINGESARYKEFKQDHYYVPEDWPEESQAALQTHAEDCYARYHAEIERLVLNGVKRKRAKESARFYLPYATQIQADVMFNWRSFAHFQKLRNSEHAQKEIRDLAAEMLRQVEMQCPEFKFTIAALRNAGYLPA